MVNSCRIKALASGIASFIIKNKAFQKSGITKYGQLYFVNMRLSFSEITKGILSALFAF